MFLDRHMALFADLLDDEQMARLREDSAKVSALVEAGIRQEVEFLNERNRLANQRMMDKIARRYGAYGGARRSGEVDGEETAG